jgi:hypothetical protein
LHNSKIKAFNSKQDEKFTTPIPENKRNQQLVLSHIFVTVGRFFNDNLQHPSTAVRLWTANWSSTIKKASCTKS